MDFAYGEAFTESSPEAYERLLLDVLHRRPAAVPAAPGGGAVLARCSTRSSSSGPEHGKPDQYPAGSTGPASADALLARDGRTWRRL